MSCNSLTVVTAIRKGSCVKWAPMAAFLLFVLFVSLCEGACLTIKDKRGVENTVEVPVRRAVFHINYEFIPALEIWDRVVGLGGTAFTNDLVIATMPAQQDIPSLGDIDKINVELLMKVNPDVLITWSYNDDELDFIQKNAKIPVIAFYPESLSEFYWMFAEIGAMFGKRERAERVIHEIENILGLIGARTDKIPQAQRKKVLWLGAKPTTVTGKLDPKNEIVEIMGAKNPGAVLQKNAGEVSLEHIVSWNPDAVFITWFAPYSPESLLTNPQWKHVEAVKNRRVFKAPPWSTWSPRLAPIALWMAVKVYPERFKDLDIEGIMDDFFHEVFHIPYAKVTPAGG